MKLSDGVTVFLGDGGWQVGIVRGEQTVVEPVSFEADAAIPARVEQIRQKLADMGALDQLILLALPSSWCLCATISTQQLERGGRRRAMGFQLEEHLPLSAEQFVADYLPIGEGQAMGVCAEYEKLKAIVDAFDQSGLVVRHICPAALLAAADVVEQQPDAQAVLIGPGVVSDEAEAQAGGWDCIALRKGRSTQWRLTDDLAQAEAQAEAWGASQEGQGQVVLLAGDQPDSDAGPRCVRQAVRVLDGVATAWIDLRQDRLAPPARYQAYRRSAGALIAALVLLLVSVSVVGQWRGRQYKALARGYVQAQVEVFKGVMPGQRVPVSIKTRLLSERKKLTGLGGGPADEQEARPTSALLHLSKVLESLPAEIRYRVLDLSIQPELIRIEGQARNPVEAEHVALSLRGSGAYEVEPPKTQAMRDNRVSFVFTAKPRSAAAAQQRSGS